MKKAGVLLMGLLLLSAALAVGAPKVVVKTMAYGDNSNPEGVNWLRIVAAFEKANPDIDIDFELLYDEVYHQKVVARLAVHRQLLQRRVDGVHQVADRDVDRATAVNDAVPRREVDCRQVACASLVERGHALADRGVGDGELQVGGERLVDESLQPVLERHGLERAVDCGRCSGGRRRDGRARKHQQGQPDDGECAAPARQSCGATAAACGTLSDPSHAHLPSSGRSERCPPRRGRPRLRCGRGT